MGRLMALDVGRKRTGIAVTDAARIVCTGLPTLPTGQVPEFLVEYCAREVLDCLVVGAPRTMDNQESEAERYIVPLLNRLRKLLPTLPIERHDERFTSRMAQRALLAGGATRQQRQDKGLVDKVSAVLILESYLEARSWAQGQTREV